MKNKTKIIVIIILSVLIVSIIGGSFAYYKVQTSPITNVSEEHEITVENYSSGKAVFNKLEEDGAIKNSDMAYLYAKLFHEPNFKAGKYKIDASWHLDTIIDYLSDGQNALEDVVTITFKEGEWLKHYASKLAEETNLTYEEIVEYWNNRDVFTMYQAEYPFLTNEVLETEGVRYLLEGYLFPDTYSFYKETDLDTVTRKFLDRTLEVYNELIDDFNNSSLSVHKVFTLASIVQYETGKVEDMPLVAGVYMNRLNDDYPLQSSVTTCYAIDISEGDDWRKCEFSNDVESPYNTMENAGLPPSPILNPGKDALSAALNPAETDYYFFVGDVCNNTGDTYFSETYEEHMDLIEEYLTCLN